MLLPGLTPPGPTINDLAFMAGAWACPNSGGVFEEHWLAPAGGTMQGTGRLVIEGKTRMMEFLSIETSETGITMWILIGAPSKGKRPAVPFKLTNFDGTTAEFSNPENDFPARIYYAKSGGAKLKCWLEGKKDSQPMREDYPFERIKA